jgi:hypothetical protein
METHSSRILTTARSKGHFEADTNDHEHDSNANGRVIARNRPDDTDEKHEETHEPDSGEI